MSNIQTHKLISVIIPVYNVAPYLRRCINSVIRQTYKNLEIILIDDGSTDGSSTICDQYRDIDTRIKAFHTENRGLSEARNYGFEMSHGEYILYIDSDDYIDESYVEILYKKIVESGAGFVQSGLVYIGNKYLNKRKGIELNKSCKPLTSEEYIRKVLKGEVSVTVWGKLFERNIIDSVKNPPGRFFEDNAVICHYAKLSHYICIEDKAIYYYTYGRDGSITTTISEKGLKDLIWARNVLVKDCIRLFPNLRDEALRYHKSSVLSFGAMIIKKVSVVNVLFPFLLREEDRVFLRYLRAAKRYIRRHLKDYLKYLPIRRRLLATSICYAPWVYAVYIKLRDLRG